MGQSVGFFDVRASERTADDIDSEGHGTLVSGQIAGVRDGDGIHGLAYNSNVLDIRADRPGSCLETGADADCRFEDADLVTAIEFAVDNGAQVINMSLGGEIDADLSLEQAIFDAAAAGVLVVISAGNEAIDTDGNLNPDASRPTEPAYIAGEAEALGRVLAVGSTLAVADDGGEVGDLSPFSNRAGEDAQDFFILAPGDGVVTTGPDDDIVFPDAPTCSATVTSDCNDTDAIGDYYRVAGTSFAAPYVAGSLALLLEAFPNLAPEEAVDLLITTADDYVDAEIDPIAGVAAGVGTDVVSGVGSLNLAAAFTPQGATAMQVNGLALAPTQIFAPGASGAFGDFAAKPGGLGDLVLVDAYNRAFDVDATGLADSGASTFTNLQTRAAWSAGQSRAVQAAGLSFHWHTPAVYEDRQAPFQAEPEGTFSGRYSFAGGEIEFGRGGAITTLAPAANLTSDYGRSSQFASGGQWARVSRHLGETTIDFHSAESGPRSASGAGISRHGEAWTLRAGVTVAEDQASALGGQIQSRFGAEDDRSNSAAYALEGAYALSGDWTLRGGVEASTVELPGLATTDIWTSRWSMSASRPFAGGELAFVVAQPQRAESGRFQLTGAVGADANGLVIDTIDADLTPTGRQIDFETRYSFAFSESWTGEAIATVSDDANHIADADMAGAVWFGVRGRW